MSATATWPTSSPTRSPASSPGLSEGQLDIGLAHAPPPSRSLKLRARRPGQLAAATGHPLLKLHRKLTLRDITAYPVSLPLPGYGLRQRVQSVEYLEGLKRRPSFETNSLSALRSYVLSGSGVTFLARSSIEQECRAGTLGCKKLQSDISEKSEVHLFSQESARLMPSVERLLKHVVRHFRKGPPRIGLPAGAG